VYRLEVIASTLQEAIDAQTGGADSVEICVDLAVGGLTPPLDLARAIRDAVIIDTHMMIRPHAASFYYTPHDIDVILRAAESAARIGVTQIVFGALTSNAEVDLELVRQVKQAAGGMALTFHRALDDARDPTGDVAALRGLADRILSSGGAPNIREGRERMGAWVRMYGAALRFACAGGVTLDNLPELVRTTGAPEYHVGSAARSNGVVEVARVRSLRETLDRQGQ